MEQRDAVIFSQGGASEGRDRCRFPVDPWRLRLERVRGKIDYDGLERVTSQTLLDLLEVPQRNRRAGVFRRVAGIMAELGWTPVRVRDLTGRGYKEQVRGYYRDGRHT